MNWRIIIFIEKETTGKMKLRSMGQVNPSRKVGNNNEADNKSPRKGFDSWQFIIPLIIIIFWITRLIWGRFEGSMVTLSIFV